jgi:hypothetical protein
VAITNQQAFRYAADALDAGLVIVSDEMTAGPSHTAMGTGHRIAVFIDHPWRHGPSAGFHGYSNAYDAARVILARYGRGKTRLLAESAYERAGLAAPPLPGALKHRTRATARRRR